MSLSFVASAVQTGTESGGYEEVAIESKEADAVNKRNQHKPLVEQLRDNQEEEDAKREDQQREMMRGTCALDEDDVAHLETLARQRKDREDSIQKRTEDELAEFRAARAEHQQTTIDDQEDEAAGTDALPSSLTKPDTSIKKVKAVVPKIVARRKRKAAPNAKSQDDKAAAEVSSKRRNSTIKATSAQNTLGGLIGDYGSSDDDSS